MFVLSPEARVEIDTWIAKFPPEHKKSALLQALRVAQEHNQHYLTEDVMNAVAAYLGISNIEVYEVATFYSMYNHEIVGKYQINVCHSISCQLNACDKLIDHVERKLNIQCGQTTKDQKFTLKKVGCLGACVGAPMCQINKDYYENLTNEKIDQILEDLE